MVNAFLLFLFSGLLFVIFASLLLLRCLLFYLFRFFIFLLLFCDEFDEVVVEGSFAQLLFQFFGGLG